MRAQLFFVVVCLLFVLVLVFFSRKFSEKRSSCVDVVCLLSNHGSFVLSLHIAAEKV